MLRYIKNKLEGRKRVIGEESICKLGFDSRDVKDAFIARSECRLEDDYPIIALKRLQSRIKGNINIKTKTNSWGRSLFPDDIMVPKRRQYSTVDEAVAFFRHLKDIKPHVVDLFYLDAYHPNYGEVQKSRHQVFGGKDDERHYLDLRYDAMKQCRCFRREFGGLPNYGLFSTLKVSLDFLVAKEGKK